MVTLLEDHLRQQPGVTLRKTSTGRGLCARHTFQEGDVVYTDVPIVFVHHDYSNRCSRCCAGCLRVVGSVEEQLRHALGQGPAKSCPCGAEFCKSCLNAPHVAWHRVTCNNQAWEAFRQYCRKKANDSVLLGGIALCQLWSLVLHYQMDSEVLHREFMLIPSSTTVGAEGRDGMAALRTDIDVPEIWAMLFPVIEPLASKCGGVQCTTMAYFSRLLALFDVVNAEIEFSHPLNTVFRRPVRSNREKLRLFKPLVDEVRAVVSCASEGVVGALETFDADQTDSEDEDAICARVLPPIMALGLVRLIGLTNHSCAPNAEVDYVGSSEAVVTALRDIKKGEQIVISYIDETQSREVRREELRRRYRFDCSCEACEAEENG